MKKLIGLMVFLFVIGGFASADVSVEPDTYETTLVAGETFKQNFTVSWSGPTDEVGRITTLVNGKEDAEGFEIEYSENPIVLNGDREIEMNVHTSPALIPDNYTLETEVEVEQEKGSGSTRTKTINVTDDEEILRLNQTIEDLKELIDEKEEEIKELETNEKEMKREKDELQGELDNLTRAYNELEKEYVQERGEVTLWTKENKLLVGILLVFLVSILIIDVRKMKKHGDEKNDM